MINAVFKQLEKELLGVGFVYSDDPRKLSLVHKDNDKFTNKDTYYNCYIELYSDKRILHYRIEGGQVLVSYDYPNEPFENIYSKLITDIRESEVLKPYVKTYLRREKIKLILKDD